MNTKTCLAPFLEKVLYCMANFPTLASLSALRSEPKVRRSEIQHRPITITSRRVRKPISVGRVSEQVHKRSMENEQVAVASHHVHERAVQTVSLPMFVMGPAFFPPMDRHFTQK